MGEPKKTQADLKSNSVLAILVDADAVSVNVDDDNGNADADAADGNASTTNADANVDDKADPVMVADADDGNPIMDTYTNDSNGNNDVCAVFYVDAGDPIMDANSSDNSDDGKAVVGMDTVVVETVSNANSIVVVGFNANAVIFPKDGEGNGKGDTDGDVIIGSKAGKGKLNTVVYNAKDDKDFNGNDNKRSVGVTDSNLTSVLRNLHGAGVGIDGLTIVSTWFIPPQWETQTIVRFCWRELITQQALLHLLLLARLLLV